MSEALYALANAFDAMKGEITAETLAEAARNAAERTANSEWEERMGEDL